MNRSLLSALIVIAIAFVGCKHKGAISQQEPLIREPSTADFGLSGSWIEVDDPVLPNGGIPQSFVVSAGDASSQRRITMGCYGDPPSDDRQTGARIA